jgi:hypothetical protein
MIKFKFTYKGPVLMFDKVVATDYKCETIAENEKKAATNMVYNFKKDHNLVQSTRVTIKKDLIKNTGVKYMY